MDHSDRVWRRTPLGVAARKGGVRLVRALHESGVSLDAGGCAPILDACFYGRRKTVEYLLQHEADIKAVSYSSLPNPTTYGVNCIMSAVASRSLPVLRTVLSHARGEVNINAVCEHSGECALGHALRTGRVELLPAIIGAGADTSVLLRHRALVHRTKDGLRSELIEEARASSICGLIEDHHRRDLLWSARRKPDAVHAIINRTNITFTSGNPVHIRAVRAHNANAASPDWLRCRVSRAQALPEVTVCVWESKQTLNDAEASNRRESKRPAEATARASTDSEELSSGVGRAVVKHAIESLNLSLLLEVLGSYGRDDDPQAPPSTSSDTAVAGFCGEGLPHDDGYAPDMFTRSRRCYFCQSWEGRDEMLVCRLCGLGMHKGCTTKHSLGQVASTGATWLCAFCTVTWPLSLVTASSPLTALPPPDSHIPPEIVYFRTRQSHNGQAKCTLFKARYFRTPMCKVFKYFAERQGSSPGMYRFTYHGRVVTGNLTPADLRLDGSSVIRVTRHPMLPPDGVLALAAGEEEGDDGEDDESGDEEDDDGDNDGVSEGEEGEADVKSEGGS